MVDIKILGTGCKKCTQLYDLAEKAAIETEIEYDINKVTELNEIMDYGVMMTPALVVNGEVKTVGKVPKIEEIKEYLKKV